MPNILSLFFLALCACCSQVMAAAPDPQMSAAIEKLVDLQDFEKVWPTLFKGEVRRTTLELETAAHQAYDRQQYLTPAQLARSHEAVKQTVPELAAEVDALYRKTLVKETFREMGQTIYPKYFTVSEIEEMTRFYSSPTYRRTAELTTLAADEAVRTGVSLQTLGPKYMANLTLQETQVLLDFGRSAIGQKLKRLDKALSDDRTAFMVEKLRSGTSAVRDSYIKGLSAKLLKEFMPDAN